MARRADPTTDAWSSPAMASVRDARRRAQRNGWLGCLGGGTVVAIGFVVLVSAMGSQLKGCDFTLGPGNGTHSKHLPIEVSRTTGLRGGEVVTVSSTAFDRESVVAVALCLQKADTKRVGVDACDVNTRSRYAVNSKGQLSADYRVPRVMTVDGRAYDCAARPKRCILVAANVRDFDESGDRPLSFVPHLPKVPLVASTDRPQTNHLPIVASVKGPLRDGQQVGLLATGFEPGEPLLVAWCTEAFETKGPVQGCQPLDAHLAVSAIGFSKLDDITFHADAQGRAIVTITARRLVRPYGEDLTRALNDLAATTWTTTPTTTSSATTTSLAPRSGDAVCTVGSKGRCFFVISAAADSQRSAVLPYVVGS